MKTGEAGSGSDRGRRRSSCARVPPSAVGALVIVMTAIAFWQLRVVGPVRLPQDVGFWNGDLYNIYYPSFAFAYRGEQFLPRWDPWQLAGTPFLAGYNGGFLYPPNWLATIVPVHLALGWLCAMHLAFAGVTTLVAARVLALGWPAAFASALIFMLSARFTGEATWPSYLAAHSWVPAVGLAAGLFVRSPSTWRGAVLGMVLALQFLTGIAQHGCYEGYLLPLAGTVAWLVRQRIDLAWARRFAVGLGVAAATVVGLAAVQLLPTLEVVAAAARGGGMTLKQAGIPGPALQELRALAPATGPVLGLVAMGVGMWRRRWVGAAAVGMLVALLFAVSSSFFTWVFTTLPGIDLFRLPNRIVPMATFPFALLAGLGLDLAHRRRGRSSLLAVRTVAAVVVLALGAPALAASPQRWPGLLVLVAIAGVLLTPNPRARHAAAWAVVAAIGVERFVNTRNPVMLTQNNPASYFAPPQFVAWLRREAPFDRVIIIKDSKHRYPYMEKAGELWELHVAQDYAPLVLRDYRAFYEPLAHAALGVFFTGRVQPSPTDPGWRMLDLLAVRWVVVPPALRWIPTTNRFRRAYAGPDAVIYENLGGMPRAYFARGVRRVANQLTALGAVQSPKFDPHAEVILEGATPTAESVGSGDVRIVSEANDDVVLHTESAAGGVLVLTDLYWPGWHATVDGAPVEILRANSLFRAIDLAPGAHDVHFWYVAERFRVGALVSMLTSGAILALWWRERRERVHRRDERLAATSPAEPPVD